MPGSAAGKKKTSAQPGWRDELVLARRPALLFAAVLALSALAVGISSKAAADNEQRLAAAARVREQAWSRLRNVASEQQDIQTYQPRFVALRGAGLIGAENRLGWVETVRQAQAQRKLPSVSYDIEPQQAVTMDQPLELADYQLRASRMQLHMGLVHEMDLFGLLDDLRAVGLYSVEDCKLRRAPIQGEAGLAPRVLGECTLVWLSLGTKGAH